MLLLGSNRYLKLWFVQTYAFYNLIKRNICYCKFYQHKYYLNRYCFLFHSVEKRELYYHWKIFRQINSLVISLVNALLSRNFCRKYFRNIMHSVKISEIFPHCENFSSNWFTVVKYLIWRNFCKKIAGEKFANFHTV